MWKKILSFYEKWLAWSLLPILREEWRRPPFSRINERILEYGFAMEWLGKLCPKEVLDVGTGTTAWPHILANCGFRVTAIDKSEGYWQGRLLNRHYLVLRHDILRPQMAREFEFITCISVLEHIPQHDEAVKNMFGLLKKGGHMTLTVPFNEEKYIENVYKLPGASYGKSYSFPCQVFSRREINQWVKGGGGEIVDQRYFSVFTGEFWTFGDRVYPPEQVSTHERHQLTCILVQKC